MEIVQKVYGELPTKKHGKHLKTERQSNNIMQEEKFISRMLILISLEHVSHRRCNDRNVK